MGQLEVKTDLLNYIIAIVLITVGLAAALALGLGSREVAGQIIAGIYVRELYQVGQQVKVGDVEGTIEEIGTVKTILLTEEESLCRWPTVYCSISELPAADPGDNGRGCSAGRPGLRYDWPDLT